MLERVVGACGRNAQPAAIITAIPMTTDIGSAQELIDTLTDAHPGPLIGVGGLQQDAIDNPAAVRLGHSFVAARSQLGALLNAHATP